MHRKERIDIRFRVLRTSSAPSLVLAPRQTHSRFGRSSHTLLDAVQSGLLDVQFEALAQRIEAGGDAGEEEVHAVEVGFLFLVEKLREGVI